MPKADYAGGFSGAASGASAGASVGGPIGAVIGAVTGGAAGLWGGGKKKKKPKKLSTLDERQQRLNEEQYQSLRGEGPLADLYNYDPEAANAVFDKTRVNPSYRNFREHTAPGVTGQFRSQGLMQSSYAGDALARIARDIQENLDAERSKYLYGEQTDARNAKRGAVENLQNRQTFAYEKPDEKPFDISSLLNSITPESAEKFKGLFKSKPAAA